MLNSAVKREAVLQYLKEVQLLANKSFQQAERCVNKINERYGRPDQTWIGVESPDNIYKELISAKAALRSSQQKVSIAWQLIEGRFPEIHMGPLAAKHEYDAGYDGKGEVID